MSADVLLLKRPVEDSREKRKKRVSHRYDRLPLLQSWPGGVQQELVVPAVQRYNNFRVRQELDRAQLI